MSDLVGQRVFYRGKSVQDEGTVVVVLPTTWKAAVAVVEWDSGARQEIPVHALWMYR